MPKKLNTRNPFEETGWKQLKRAKADFEFESERIKYVIEATYIPDFIISGVSNGKIYVEFKGRFRREDKRKLCAVKKCNPDMDLRIVFYRLDKSNVKWADKNAIPWAIGKIPREWLRC